MNANSVSERCKSSNHLAPEIDSIHAKSVLILVISAYDKVFVNGYGKSGKPFN